MEIFPPGVGVLRKLSSWPGNPCRYWQSPSAPFITGLRKGRVVISLILNWYFSP